MAEANTSIPIAESTVTISGLKRLLSQHFRSLSQAGVETLPKGSGQFQFDLNAVNVETTVSATTDIPPVTSAVELQVRESISENYSSRNETPNLKNHKLDETTQSVPLPTPERHIKVPSKSSQRLPMAIPGDQKSYCASLPMLARKSALELLQAEVAACTRCRDLSNCRTQTVFGTGNLTPRLVFLGEAPGADEDKKGEPFVGASGELLNKIMTASKLKREEVYILNTVKCRPPNNRTPTQAELDNCWQYAMQQLEILQPEFICCLGSVAAKRLLNSGLALGRLRGQFHRYHDSRVVVTYHPSYLLRTGNEKTKRLVWEDMKMLRKEMGVEL